MANFEDGRLKTVQDVRDYALVRYNEGGDGVYECYSSVEINKLIGECIADNMSLQERLDRMFHINKQMELEHNGFESGGIDDV